MPTLLWIFSLGTNHSATTTTPLAPQLPCGYTADKAVHLCGAVEEIGGVHVGHGRQAAMEMDQHHHELPVSGLESK